MSHTLNPVEIEGQDYVSAVEASEYLGLSLRTIYNLIDKRDSPLIVREAFGRQVIGLNSLEAEKTRRAAESGTKETPNDVD